VTQNSDFDYLLIGGGLASGLVCLALAHFRPKCRVAVVERGARLGGNHTWCFHADDLGAADAALVAPLVDASWSSYDVEFQGFARRVGSAYAVVGSRRFANVVERVIGERGGALFTSVEASSVEAHRVVLADGRRLTARAVIDARGPERFTARERVAFQKFLGLELELARPHDLERPILMDARVPQTDGFRFFYVLPLTPTRVLVEDTYYSDGPDLDPSTLRREVLTYAGGRGLEASRIVREETGVLPIPRRSGPAPASGLPLVAGYQGGWFHPTTGYSFPAAVRLALHLASREPEAIFDAAWSSMRREHERQQRFFLFLNRLLFDAFRPEDRWNVLARFYRLPEPTIRRFYAMTTTTTDRARILCGRPPRGLSVRAALGRGATA
jgi:lycopene beta-cyclase